MKAKDGNWERKRVARSWKGGNRKVCEIKGQREGNREERGKETGKREG